MADNNKKSSWKPYSFTEPRTAEQSIFVTGSKPNVPLDHIQDKSIFDPSGLPYGILGGYISNNSKQ